MLNIAAILGLLIIAIMVIRLDRKVMGNTEIMRCKYCIKSMYHGNF